MSEHVRMVSREVLSDNWSVLEKVTFELRRRDGVWQSQVRECYNRGNAAVILLCNPEAGTVLLTRQFHYPVFSEGESGFLVEACAGLLDGDTPEVCALKEAQEETGCTPLRIEHVFDSYMSPGSVTEKLSFFLGFYDAAARSQAGGGLAEEGEDIEVMEIDFRQSLEMIRTSDIEDGKTIMLLQHAALAGVFGAP